MPRGPRLDAPGVVHHVRIRGVGRRDLFLDDDDRENFLARLDRIVPELGFTCFAWALMPNHAHLLVRSGPARISLLMARLCTGYALYFNKRHRWVGHVFQNRFSSSRVGDDAYLTTAIAYVLRNPIEARLVSLESLDAYPWTSYGAVVGARRARPFESARATLAPFAGDAARLLAAIARASLDLEPTQWRRPPRAARPAPAHKRARSFGALLAEVARRGEIQPARIASRERAAAVATARRLVAVRAVRELGMPLAEVARRLGVSASAVTQMLQRASADRRTFLTS